MMEAHGNPRPDKQLYKNINKYHNVSLFTFLTHIDINLLACPHLPVLLVGICFVVVVQ
jgi:hypothetical protein